MTSFAFILGVLPLVIAKGAGAEMDQALGTAVFAGMIGVTFFGIFLTPVFFSVIMKIFKPGSAPRPENHERQLLHGAVTNNGREYNEDRYQRS
jgi:multidrug efflux pump